MYDNPAPVVYERAPSDEGGGEDSGGGGGPGGGGSGGGRRAAGGGGAAACSPDAFLRAAEALFACPGPWEAAFDPRAAGLLDPRAPTAPPAAAAAAAAAAEATGTRAAAATDKATGGNAAAAAAAPAPDDGPTTTAPDGGPTTAREPIDAAEIFDLIRGIQDPEHPYSLEQLGVVSRAAVRADDAKGTARVEVTPTVEHCSMATLIGLCVKARLDGALPSRFKVVVALAPGSHATEGAVNRQLADKERVAAAMENARLRAEVDRCLAA